MSKSSILGVSAFYHDAAACVVTDGVIVAAAQEERFTRIKGDARFPAAAIAYCLREAGIRAGELEAVVFYEKPLLKLDRLLDTYLSIAPRGFRSFLKAAPLWATDRLRVEQIIRRALDDFDGRVLFAEHHASHAASAFYPSPFHDAAVLTVDGVGEWASASMGVGHGAELELTHELRWPDSLGLLYSAFTYHAGFRVNSGEYKLMGLAPYGEPKYVDTILNRVVDLRDDGSFALNQRYFDYLGGLTMTNAAFADIFGGPVRQPESRVTQREMDLARSVQDVCEEIVIRMARTALAKAGCSALCLAGGVALNAVANGRLLRERVTKDLWVQPASGDAGGALGAALWAWHAYFNRERTPCALDSMNGALLGPAFTRDEISASLSELGATVNELGRGETVARAADALASGRAVGWFDGRMEFGPRSLGARSILADARDPSMQARLNLKIKFRESFRPFAPSVLASRADEYFDIVGESPYMLIVSPVKETRRIPEPSEVGWGIERLSAARSDIPAVTHVDHSARVQTVSADRAPGMHEVLSAFAERTGCPVLVNTSFNVRGEPIVCTPADAYRCFMATDLDCLAIPPFFLEKSEQPARDVMPIARALD
ncbi:MAG TPA: carbamoyltransferase [Gemmatimonadaceae bacterium]